MTRHITPASRNNVAEQARQIIVAMPDGAIVEMPKRVPLKRSTQANAYLWGVVYPTIIQRMNLPYTAEELHDCFGREFWPDQRANPITGELEAVARRTREMRADEFAYCLERVIQWAAEQGVEVPQPVPFVQPI